MTDNANQSQTDTADTTKAVVIERHVDAPAELVWRMWTEPEHFAAWYGPTGASIPVAEMDVRVGGGRLICMELETPNGPMQMWFTGEYREVDEHRRLVYTESMSDETGAIVSPSTMGMPEGYPVTTTVTVELSDTGDGTTMKMTHAGVPSDSPGAAGWLMALDKLSAHIAAQRAE